MNTGDFASSVRRRYPARNVDGAGRRWAALDGFRAARRESRPARSLVDLSDAAKALYGAGTEEAGTWARFGLPVTKGALVRLLHRTAAAALLAYGTLAVQLRRSPAVTPDETGWRVKAGNHWLWAGTTADTMVYAIRKGRGFNEAAAMLGPDFAGVLVRDGWAAYRGFKRALHQTCLAHLLRRCKNLKAAHPGSPWADEVQAVLLLRPAPLVQQCGDGGTPSGREILRPLNPAKSMYRSNLYCFFKNTIFMLQNVNVQDIVP